MVQQYRGVKQFLVSLFSLKAKTRKSKGGGT